jgi:hypothetical protein
MTEFNLTSMPTIAKLAGLGPESNRFCYYCGAERVKKSDGLECWYGGEPDCAHLADLNEDDPRENR